MPIVSHIPAAIDGLLALCATQASGTLVNVSIYDGPPVHEPSEQLQLYIGSDLDVDRYAVTGTQVPQTMGGAREETFAITCAAVSRSGDTVIKTERDRAFSVMGAVETLVRQSLPGSDITLGGAVLVSYVSGDIKLLQVQATDGAYVKLTFYVQCLARI